ncbi:hypothetical protein QTP86_011682 [Hemibagrus guttatus]|nr:hypothetical protein QTP86_011682 [Hemibagrus guttatus]
MPINKGANSAHKRQLSAKPRMAGTRKLDRALDGTQPTVPRTNELGSGPNGANPGKYVKRPREASEGACAVYHLTAPRSRTHSLIVVGGQIHSPFLIDTAGKMGKSKDLSEFDEGTNCDG